MAVKFSGILGHIFTSYPAIELNRLGFESIAIEDSKQGITNHFFQFESPDKGICFLNLIQINEEDKFLKSQGTLFPEVVVSGDQGLPLKKEAHNILFTQRSIPLMKGIESLHNKAALSCLITDLTANDFNKLSLSDSKLDSFEFENKFKLIGNYQGPLFELLKVRKESGAWCLIVDVFNPSLFNSIKQLPTINWEGRTFHHLKEASINFDILFCLAS